MLKFILIAIICFSNLLLSADEVTTVEKVDLLKYQGTWYEIAKLPNWFQRKCEKNVTATYKLKEDGNISVINTCIEKDGKVNQIEGMAKIADSKSNAKLEVSFVRFFWKNWFYGNYWIIGLADDYSWAIVGEGSRKYAWILAREKILDQATMQEVFSILEEKGYDPKEFEMTWQE